MALPKDKSKPVLVFLEVFGMKWIKALDLNWRVLKIWVMFQGFKGISTVPQEINTFMIFRPRVVDLSFIVTRAHQKIKALFCRTNFDYKKFCKKNVLLSIFLHLKVH